MTFMICGEKDPFVDDTVIFAGRIRQAKRKYRQDHPLDEDFPSHDGVRVKFLEGISHAFLQMMAFLPEAHQSARIIGDWIKEIAESHHPNADVPISDHHVAEIITSEKDMIHRRKQQLVKGLF
jgi:acetyl esterase/lipase